MKSPSYIVKSAYHERNQQRGLEFHVKKLNEISTIPPCVGVIETRNQINQQRETRNRNKLHSSRFHEMESLIERNRETENLVEKMKSIDLKPKNYISLKTSYSKSLISSYKKKEENRIILENFNMAKRMINLPAVISMKKFDQAFLNHQNDLNILRKHHSVKNLSQIDSNQPILSYLQRITKDTFIKTKSGSNFAYLLPKIYKNQTLHLIKIISVQLYTKHTYKESKIPATFFWEINQQSKVLHSTKPVDFEQAQQILIDFVCPFNAQFNIILYKVKNHNDIYIGQSEIDVMENMMQEKCLNIERGKFSILESETQIIPLIKIIDTSSAPVGLIQFKIIILKRKNPSGFHQIEEKIVEQSEELLFESNKNLTNHNHRDSDLNRDELIFDDKNKNYEENQENQQITNQQTNMQNLEQNSQNQDNSEPLI